MSSEIQDWLKSIIDSHEYAADQIGERYDQGIQYMAEQCLARLNGDDYCTPQPYCVERDAHGLTPEDKAFLEKHRAEQEELARQRRIETDPYNNMTQDEIAQAEQEEADAMFRLMHGGDG